jgi:hypothetical protein
LIVDPGATLDELTAAMIVGKLPLWQVPTQYVVAESGQAPTTSTINSHIAFDDIISSFGGWGGRNLYFLPAANSEKWGETTRIQLMIRYTYGW